VAGDLEGIAGKVLGKEERTGAHRNGGSTVRRCQRSQAVAFVGGEAAPVVAGGGDEVLQLRRGEGVRDLPEISGVPWGLAPIGGWHPAANRARRSRATCAARARAGRTERGERELTGGPRHSAGRRCH
jgi:hypothetical protein